MKKAAVVFLSLLLIAALFAGCNSKYEDCDAWLTRYLTAEEPFKEGYNALKKHYIRDGKCDTELVEKAKARLDSTDDLRTRTLLTALLCEIDFLECYQSRKYSGSRYYDYRYSAEAAFSLLSEADLTNADLWKWMHIFRFDDLVEAAVSGDPEKASFLAQKISKETKPLGEEDRNRAMFAFKGYLVDYLYREEGDNSDISFLWALLGSVVDGGIKLEDEFKTQEEYIAEISDELFLGRVDPQAFLNGTRIDAPAFLAATESAILSSAEAAPYAASVGPALAEWVCGILSERGVDDAEDALAVIGFVLDHAVSGAQDADDLIKRDVLKGIDGTFTEAQLDLSPMNSIYSVLDAPSAPTASANVLDSQLKEVLPARALTPQDKMLIVVRDTKNKQLRVDVDTMLYLPAAQAARSLEEADVIVLQDAKYEQVGVYTNGRSGYASALTVAAFDAKTGQLIELLWRVKQQPASSVSYDQDAYYGKISWIDGADRVKEYLQKMAR